ncbi:MAG: hypothetical protein JJ896_03535 [Rhodothermales bacterium]|nr:hypothetical protein [Rhodothermales bacterium]MBO6778706.1 hypothetical protein [Rhodothermales bacterium]
MPPRLLPLLVLCLVCVRASGQNLQVRTLSVSEGLSQSSAQVIYQDRLGIVWIGTEVGLNRFDGHEVTRFNHRPDEPGSLPGASVVDITEDEAGSLWVATEPGGLARFDREARTFSRVALPDILISAVAPDTSGALWLGTDNGLLRLNPATGDTTRYSEGLAGAWVIDLRTAVDGSLLITSEGGGLTRMAGGLRFEGLWPTDGDTTYLPVGIEADTDPSGGIWLGTPEGLVHLDAASETVHRTPGLENEFVLSVLAHSDGTVWVGTGDGGLYTIPPGGTAVRVDELLELGDDTIYSLLEDASGLVWVGTSSAGAKLLTPVSRRFDALGRAMQNREVWSLLETRGGEIWAGSSDTGVDVLTPAGEVLRKYRTPDEDEEGAIPWGLVLAMAEHPDGAVWLGMDGEGFARWDPDTDQFTHYLPGEAAGLEADMITAIHIARDSSVWLATAGWGLARMVDDEVREHLIHPDSLHGANWVLSIAEDAAGALWLGTEGGVARFDPETLQATVSDDGLLGPTAFSVWPAEDGTQWAGTPHGLVHLAGPDTRVYTEADGLPNHVIYAVRPDEDGRLWMSTNAGLAVLDRATGDIRAFDPGDGLPGHEFNHGAHTTAPDGSLLFGGIEGITRVNPEVWSFRAYDPPLMVTTVDVFGEPIAHDLTDGAALRLAHDRNYVSLEFAALDFVAPENHRFAYRLEPDETEWTQAGTRRYQSYNNLAPGDYTFRLRGTNGDGLWSAQTLALDISIVPPFWQRWWFRLMGGLVLLGLAVQGVRAWTRYRVRERDARILVQQRINQRLEEERVHIARELHDGPLQQLQLSGFELQALQDTAPGKVEGLRGAIGEAMNELRAICGELRPPALVHFGLGPAIRSHAERLLERYDDLEMDLDLPAEGTMLPERARLGLFRMYQESMSNVIRHARPCRVRVSLRVGDDGTVLEVSDNGPGFRVPSGFAALAADGHFGLLGAQERVVALGGSMEVDSRPGSGTRLVFRVPA